MNSDIMSKEKPTYLIVNPGLDDVSKPPPPLHHKFEGTLDEVGPYSMQMQSQHCMVGGLLLFRLNLLFPPIDLLIYTIKVKIVQSFKLRSPIDKDHHAEPPQSAQTVFIIDASHPPNFGKIADTIKPVKPENLRSSPLKAVRQDELWKIHHLARLPNDNMIRPSTFEGTITPIAVSHTIQMEMTYRPMTEDERNPPSLDGAAGVAKKGKEKEKEPERRKVVMSKPLELFSVSGGLRAIPVSPTRLTLARCITSVLLLPRLAHAPCLLTYRPEPDASRFGTLAPLCLRNDFAQVSRAVISGILPARSTYTSAPTQTRRAAGERSRPR